MKKFKSLVSFLTACASLGAMTVPSAGAVYSYCERDPENEFYQNYFGSAVEFDDEGYFVGHVGSPFYKTFYNKVKDNIILDTSPWDYFVIELSPDDPKAEEILELAKEISPDWDIKAGADQFEYKICAYMNGTEPGSARAEVVELAKKIKGMTEVKCFNYCENQASPTVACVNANYYPTEDVEGLYSDLAGYLKDHALDFEAVVKENIISETEKESFVELVPIADVNVMDTFELLNGIYKELGYTPEASYKASAVGMGGIELAANLEGDANNDGKFTIADATIILQSLGNPDLYKLSAQGEYNADIYNAGDGVTGLDALEIQKVLARK